MRHKRSIQRFRPRLGTLAGSILAIAGCSALAQAPDAGRILDSVRERQPPGSQPPSAPPAIERPAEPQRTPGPESSVRVSVTAFEFTGNNSIDSRELAAAVAPLAGKELAYGELADAAARITQLYRSRGYIVARATLPPQDIQGGRVTIAVQEGILGQVKIERGRTTRLKEGRIESFLSGLQPGQVIRESELERALLVLTDVPGVVVRSVLRPGAAPGTADLVVQVNENISVQAQAGYDNSGSRYTGRNRFLVDIGLHDYFGIGEALSLRAITSFQDMTAYTMSASVPVGGSGLRAGVSHTRVAYRLGREFIPLGASGEAESTGVNLSMPIVRGRNANLAVTLSHERKHFIDRTFAAGSDTTKTSDLTTLGLQGDWRDSAVGPALTSFGVSVSKGHLDRTSPADAFADSLSAQTAGDFNKLNWQVSRLQSLPGGFTFNASLSGQNASKNLDSSEEFSLGGYQGVRAFPQGEGAGDEGMLARLELRRRLGTVRGFAVDGMLFYDIGRVRFDHNAWDPLQASNERTLSGAGVGLTLTRPNSLAVSVALAMPHKGRPSLTEPQRGPTLWVQVNGSPQFLNSTRVETPDGQQRGSDAFDLYGSTGVQIESVERRNATPAGPRIATQATAPTGVNVGSYLRLNDPTNTYGARGSFNLGQGLQAFWQAEIGLSFDFIDDKKTGASVPNSSLGASIRDTGVGLRDRNWGSIMYGHWGMPIRTIASALDPFGDDGIATASGIIASPGFGVGSSSRQGPVGMANNADNDDAAFKRRQSGVFQYWTPTWNGMTARFAYSNNHRQSAPDVDEGYIWGATIDWRRGPLRLMAGYERHENYFGVASLGRNNRGVGSATAVTAGTSSRDWDARIGASYRFGATEVAAMLDKMSYKESGVTAANTTPDLQSYERSAVWMGVTHTIGKLELRASAGRANPGRCKVIINDPAQQNCSTDGLGASLTAIGFSYRLTAAATVFGQYARMRNKPSSNYNFGGGGVFGGAGGTPGVGADPRGIGIGIKYRF